MRQKRAVEETQLFSETLVPLLADLEFEPAKYPVRPAVGEFIRCVSRALSPSRSLFFVMWRKKSADLDFDFVAFDGSERGSRWQLSFGLDATRTLFEYSRVPGITLAQRFVFFRACLVAALDTIALRAPELAPNVDAVRASGRCAPWLAEAAAAWTLRFVRGDLDPRAFPGQVVFRSPSMLFIEAGGHRHVFKFDTGRCEGDEVLLSDWWTSPAGTRAPLTLRAGERRWRFDFEGKLVEAS
ncbi:MAG: hypothetical protein Q8L48_09900 [Archangium sp.]|nr:hypothetical protein [Archangium sp.]